MSDRQKTRINIGRNACLFNAKKSENNCCAFVGGCGNCCFMKYAALFCRSDSAYKKRPDWDVYDADRDALTWEGGMPCVCHPPCRTWGVLAYMAFNARP